MNKYDECAADIARYLNSKLPNVDEATTMEVSEYISCRCHRLIVSEIGDVERECRQALRSQQKKFNKELNMVRRQRKGERDG